MKYEIKPKKITVGGNALLMKPLSRKAANAFREAMAATDDTSVQERIGLELIAANVTLEDGTALECDEVPNADLVEIMRRLVGGEEKGVSDFTPAP